MPIDLENLARLNAAATPDWRQAKHVGEPRAIVSDGAMDVSLIGLDRDGMAVFGREDDAAIAVAARNALPALLAIAEAALAYTGQRPTGEEPPLMVLLRALDRLKKP